MTIPQHSDDGRAAGPVATAWGWARRIVGWVVARLDDWWSRSTGAIPAGPGRDTIVVACVVGYLVIDSARRALDAAVRRIHPAGEDGVGVNSLHDGADAVDLAFDVWERGEARLGAFIRHDAVTLATAQTALELCLIPFSFALLFGVARHLRDRERRAGDLAAADVMTVAMLGAGAYALIGAYNQVAELVILGSGRAVAGWTGLLAVTGAVRPIVLLFTLVPIVAVALRPVARERKMPAAWRGFPSTYRVMIIVAALQAALMLVSIPSAQIADALRLWELRASLGAIGVSLTVLFSLTLAVYAIRTGACARPTRRVLGRTATWIFVGVGVGLLVVGSVLRFADGALSQWSPSILAAGLITTGVGVLSLPLAPATGVREQPTEPPSRLARTTVPGVLASAPLAALAVALVRAAIPAMIDRSSEVESATDVRLLVWVALVAALAVAAYPAVRIGARWAADHPAPQRNWPFRLTGIVVFAVCAVIAIGVLTDPVVRAPKLGVVGVLSIFLSLLVVGFGGVAIALDGKSLPAALDFIGFRKVPIVIGVIVLGVVSQQLDDRGYHDIATIDDRRPEDSQMTIDDAYDRWFAAAVAGAPGDPSVPVPMFLVAAAGGGIKAAAFTASTLDCLFVPTGVPPAPECPDSTTWDQVFLASGASGGSVGIASVLAELERPPVPDDPDRSGDGWVSRTLGDDLLSATAAWQLLVEVPNAVLAFNPDDDRAAILEESWRHQFDLDDDSVPFYRDRSGDWSGPIAFFSGTNLNDGCRVNVAAVRGTATTAEIGNAGSGGPAPFPTTARGTCTDRRTTGGLIDQTDTRDLVDYLCDGANIDLATAAFLSARFPYVSPAGTGSCEPSDPSTDPGTGEIAVGDGGYRDNSGADTIAQLWSVLEPRIAAHNESSDRCIVPILVEISSGYAGLDAPDVATTASQLIAPALGAKAVYSDLSYGAIEQLAAEFTRPLAPDLEVRLSDEAFPRHLRISLVEHPGVTAPLGWSLSTAAVEDFADQLRVAENSEVIERVATIVDSPDALTCTRVDTSGDADAS